MIIKKFQAYTETEAILLAKEELGKDAIVMNIKTITPRGLHKLFQKKKVEVTAAIDDVVANKKENVYDTIQEIASIGNDYLKKANNNTVQNTQELSAYNELNITKDEKKASAIEQRLNELQELVEKQMNTKSDQSTSVNENEKEQNNEYLNLIFNQMVNNEVDEKYANLIISEIESSIGNAATVDKILATIYQKIILKLGQPKIIEFEENKPKVVFFIGPTGVGKTTTIAKIASSLKINQKAKVAFLTSDTYRIAAVEQLRIYANILGIPLKVIYTGEEIKDAQREFSDYDVILVDTAGRSHKNREQRDDLFQLLNSVRKEESETYLVLSATTKYNDLLKIVDTYSEVNDYRLIFTKFDETTHIGNILNIKLATNAPLSYTTWGQNVPDDIGKVDPQNIAKQLLGGND